VKQRVTLCPHHTTALAEINGAEGACCVVLADKGTGRPTAFCATPVALPGARQFPGGVSVSLSPDCATDHATGGAAGVLACSATFTKLPRGYTLLPPHTQSRGKAIGMVAGKAAPWMVDGKGVALAPCGHERYSRFSQVAEWTKGGATTFTVTCMA